MNMTDPTFITALATLITAVSALLKVLQVERQTSENRDTLRVVNHNTNAAMTSLQATVTDLRAGQATPAELLKRELVPPKVIVRP